IGLFLGPFLGAGAVHVVGTRGAYGVGLAAVLVATIVLMLVTEPHAGQPAEPETEHTTYRQILRLQRRTFATIGVGVLLVSVVRASRQVVHPLWGDHLGLTAATISLIYGISGAVDMLLFYPAGRLMDL